MNIWDSVHRSLEKASNEAARIARAQRLRSILDGLSKQIETQQGAIIISAMELFKNGQLTQSELLPLCQALVASQQQFVQAQNELKAIQSVSNNKPNQGQQAPQAPQTQQITNEAYTQALYQPYDEPVPSLVPPPPPDIDMEPHTPAEEARNLNQSQGQALCSNCGTPLVPNNAFCHNCGTPVNTDNSSNQSTMRASIEGEEFDAAKLGQRQAIDYAELSTIRMKEDEANEQNNASTPGNGGN